MKSLFVKSSAFLWTRMIKMNRLTKISSDPENQDESCKKAHSKAAIIFFKNAFVLFYLLVCVISWWVIIGCLRSVGWFQTSEASKLCTDLKVDLNNIYDKGFSFDFNAFLSEKSESNLDSESQLIWALRNLTYYDDNEQAFYFSTNVSISEVSLVINA